MRNALFAGLLACAATIASTAPASALVNILPSNTINITGDPNHGVLHDANWSSGNTPSTVFAPIDGSKPADGTQWNNGSYWWDAVVTGASSYWTITLDKAYDFSQFIIQADDNDSYLLEYWDGSAWQNGVTIDPFGPAGLQTRPEYNVSFTTDQLRFSATGGDGYYSLGQIQGFVAGIPEPATWAMLLLGFGVIGRSLRQRNKAGYRLQRV